MLDMSNKHILSLELGIDDCSFKQQFVLEN